MKYYVYILTNSSRSVLYVGMTNDLGKRISQHANSSDRFAFTNKYNVHDLIYYEVFQQVEDAILREKQLKGWTRKKKDALILKANPNLMTIPFP